MSLDGKLTTMTAIDSCNFLHPRILKCSTSISTNLPDGWLTSFRTIWQTARTHHHGVQYIGRSFTTSWQKAYAHSSLVGDHELNISRTTSPLLHSSSEQFTKFLTVIIRPKNRLVNAWWKQGDYAQTAAIQPLYDHSWVNTQLCSIHSAVFSPTTPKQHGWPTN